MPSASFHENIVAGWSVMTSDRPSATVTTYGETSQPQVRRDAFILFGRVDVDPQTRREIRHIAVALTPGEADALAALLTEAAALARVRIVAHKAEIAEAAKLPLDKLDPRR